MKKKHRVAVGISGGVDPSASSGQVYSGINLDKESKNKSRVAIGLSGGVDSSVAGALLLRAGYEVVGVHLQCFDPEVPYCTATEDKEYAIRVAARLKIPLKIYDFRAEYKKRVIDYMLSEYEANRTPNPDAMCNREIKFGILYEHVFEELGVDYVATGHYARLLKLSRSNRTNRSYRTNGTYRFKLMMARDESKDQSYFLALLSQEQLSKALFPLGDLLKSEVRQLAHEFKLPTADKPDSQGLCFVGEVRMTEFLREHLKLVKGEVVTKEGTVVGSHEGLPLYTIGQRQGFTLPKSLGEPMYVVGKDVTRNLLVIGERDQLLRDSFEVRLLGENMGDWGNKVMRVRIRHLGSLHQCTLGEGKGLGEMRVNLEKPIEAVAPGQLAVFYSAEGGGDVVVGAGEIVETGLR